MLTWAARATKRGRRHPIRSGSDCPGRGRLGAKRLAAAAAAPESPELTDGITEPNLGALPGQLERIESCASAFGGQVDGAVQRHRQRGAPGLQGWRSRPKTVPPCPHRRVRHTKLLRDSPQPDVGEYLQSNPAPDDRYSVEPSRQHQARQQRMRASTVCAPAVSNPDTFDQWRCAQPAPIPTQRMIHTRQTGHRSAGVARTPRRHVTRRRQNAGPYDGHEGACTTLLALLVVP